MLRTYHAVFWILFRVQFYERIQLRGDRQVAWQKMPIHYSLNCLGYLISALERTNTPGLWQSMGRINPTYEAVCKQNYFSFVHSSAMFLVFLFQIPNARHVEMKRIEQTRETRTETCDYNNVLSLLLSDGNGCLIFSEHSMLLMQPITDLLGQKKHAETTGIVIIWIANIRRASKVNHPVWDSALFTKLDEASLVCLADV